MTKSVNCRRRVKATLKSWDASLSSSLRDKLLQSQQRRHFLAGLIRTGVALTSLPLLSACSKEGQFTVVALQEEPWLTLAAVHQQLFPADGNGPDASAIQATPYLYTVLNTPDMDKEEGDFILNGVNWLNGIANKQQGKAFKLLDHAQREQVLKTIVGSEAGENWLSSLLLYLFEALLSSPVYGGNTNEVGWRWLAHQAGFPLPAKEKRYTELLKART